MLLFKSERDWAYAMNFKKEMLEEPRKRHHLIRKLKRAVQYAQGLVELASSNAKESILSEKGILLMQAYAAHMNALLAFEQELWQKSLDSFGIARYISL